MPSASHTTTRDPREIAASLSPDPRYVLREIAATRGRVYEGIGSGIGRPKWWLRARKRLYKAGLVDRDTYLTELGRAVAAILAEGTVARG